MKIGVINLGCAKNLVDTENLIGRLLAGGANITSNAEEADLIIINTCGFIEPAKLESIQTILEFAENKRVIVMGCLVERYKEELQKELPEVEAFFGTQSHEEIARYLNLEERPYERVLTTPGAYAYLKIAEGCNRLCSFCAIPMIRGRHRSKPIEKIVSEAENLARKGVKELCIVSQDTGYYGKDLYHRKALVELLERLQRIEGIEWIRLLYLYPSDVDEDLLSFMASSQKVLPYLDIPLQHVSDKVLKSMRRGYTKKDIMDLLDKIHKHLPNAVLRTTFIVGYPEEEESDFQELLRLVEEGHFHWVGVFEYYHEEGTHAYSLGDKVPKREKHRRFKELTSLAKKIFKKKAKELVGRRLMVLVDGFDQEFGLVPIGRSYMHAPEVDGVIYIESERELRKGDMVEVEVLKVKDYDLVARVS
ncbi:30S ribosomal protein S12 methylthiotransferase RimO [Thermocrinis minervae]|uniref:Ribosomal protein uS12 methylthiotransferase RimO n=1 Tax=Thermocrinis minervae TaxID=381751 RepID=A0A1M6RD33_9AQUI|nr:30S ribosomal protein S12 methylthiotransferase RimO [Thermocrinis minervae]SHK30371.1 SSU ribosomal protein S12P methylthiotransferase [Thermocrinis minervae]